MLLLFKEEGVWWLQAGGRFSVSSAVTIINKNARALEEWQCVHSVCTRVHMWWAPLWRESHYTNVVRVDPNPLEYGEINYIGPEKSYHIT